MIGCDVDELDKLQVGTQTPGFARDIIVMSSDMDLSTVTVTAKEVLKVSVSQHQFQKEETKRKSLYK